jgi:Flp pilus assembly pilin Flp
VPREPDTTTSKKTFGVNEMEMIKSFAKSESGAVTVDWVVLTAAIVGLGLAVMAVVSGGVEDLAGDIDTRLTGMNADAGFLNGVAASNQ